MENFVSKLTNLGLSTDISHITCNQVLDLWTNLKTPNQWAQKGYESSRQRVGSEFLCKSSAANSKNSGMPQWADVKGKRHINLDEDQCQTQKAAQIGGESWELARAI